MQAHYFRLENDFFVFIEKRGGTYFRIRGHERLVFAPGAYVDAPMAMRSMSRLRADGYQERLVDLDA